MRLFTITLTFIILTFLFGSVLNKITIIEQLQKELNTQKIFYEDTIHCQQEYYKSILDSLPLGSPLDTLIISSEFGIRKHPLTLNWRRHPGTDFLADWRDTVYATGHGIIEKSRRNLGYGRSITIKHINGYKSRYAHLTRYFIREGDQVKKGQPIGTAGNSGNVSGYHLHYEVSRYGKETNPKEYIIL